MITRRRNILLNKGFVPVALVVLAAGTGCGSSSPAATAAAVTTAAAATSSSAAAVGAGAASASNPGPTGSAAVAVPSSPASTAPVSATPSAAASLPPVTVGKASGGGSFCKLVAAAANRAAVAGTSAADTAGRIATVRKDEAAALLLAPSAIKADVTLLYVAADKVWAALEGVHYDYSKLKAGDMSALATPDVVAAEKRLTAYMSDTCGLHPGAPTSPVSK